MGGWREESHSRLGAGEGKMKTSGREDGDLDPRLLSDLID